MIYSIGQTGTESVGCGNANESHCKTLCLPARLNSQRLSTIRPTIINKGMYYYEVIGMLELIKLEMAEKSWDAASKMRKQKK